MEVRIEKTFPLDAPPGAAWAVLQDIPAVAACMPGARITGQTDATHYQGQVAVKLGPAAAQFGGTLEVSGIDEAARELRMVGKGADSKGSSGASLALTARIREAAVGCELAGSATVSVSGKLASFGGRMLNQVADQLLQQFAANFAARVAAVPAAEAPATAPAAPAPRQLNLLALLWHALADWVKGLLRGHGSAHR